MNKKEVTEIETTIIGTGNMAWGIATRLLAGGNDVTVLGRDAESASELAGRLRDEADDGRVEAGASGDPISGDVVVLAVPYDAAISLVRQYGDGLDGKIVVDITNPLNETFDGLVTPPGSSAAEEISSVASPGARILKAFNTTFAGTLVEGEVAGQPLDVFIAGDDTESKRTVARLVRDGGLVAIDAGPLERARQMEGLGLLGITLQQPLGLNFQSAWKLIS